MGGGGEAGGSVVLFLAFFQGVGGGLAVLFLSFFLLGGRVFMRSLKKIFYRRLSVSVLFFLAKYVTAFGTSCRVLYK